MHILRSTLSLALAALCILLSFAAIRQFQIVPVFGDDSRGVDARYDPQWLAVSVLALLALAPLVSAMSALRNQRSAGILLLAVSPFVAAGWYLHLRRALDNPRPEAYLILPLFLAVPGALFLLTARAGWPPLISSRKMRMIAAALVLGGWSFFGFVGAISQPDSWSDWPCHHPFGVLYASKFPNHVAFTGRVVFAHNGFWCIMHVEHRYWGLPSWFPNFVVVRGSFREGEQREYLVDGTRSRQLALHFLPVVELYPCCHLAPVEEAKADLRVLGSGMPKSGVRIVGTVHRGYYEFGHAFPGATVFIKGPGGTISATTDQEGIYDRAGLPPGHYTVQVDSGGPPDHHSYSEGNVHLGEAWGGTLYALTYPTTAAPGR